MMDKPDRTLRIRRSGSVLALKQDGGWTFIEAMFSVILISVVFLGFTISLMALRETFNRAWAMRIMDQYALNFSEELRRKLRTATDRYINPPQYNYNAFRLKIPEYKFGNLINIILAQRNYNFSVNPVEGIRMGIDNVSPQPYDVEFQHTNWSAKHRFFIGDFKLDTEYFKENGVRQSYFYDSMAKIDFTIRYERARELESPQGLIGRTFIFEKSYTVSAFMKNHLDQPD